MNPTVRLALMLIIAPVWEFLPLRALRERTVNVPNPGNLKALALFDGSGDALEGCIHSVLCRSFAKLGTFATVSIRSPFVIAVTSLLAS